MGRLVQLRTHISLRRVNFTKTCSNSYIYWHAVHLSSRIHISESTNQSRFSWQRFATHKTMTIKPAAAGSIKMCHYCLWNIFIYVWFYLFSHLIHSFIHLLWTKIPLQQMEFSLQHSRERILCTNGQTSSFHFIQEGWVMIMRLEELKPSTSIRKIIASSYTLRCCKSN